MNYIDIIQPQNSISKKTTQVVLVLAASWLLAISAQFSFNLPFSLHGWLWLAGPLSGIVIISISGNLAARSVINRPPMSSFREVY